MFDAMKSWLLLGVLAALLGATFTSGYAVRDQKAAAEIAELKREAAETMTRALRAQAEQTERTADAERRLRQEQTEIAHETHRQLAESRAAVERNRARDRLLSNEVARLTGLLREPADPAAAATGEAEAAAQGLHELFDVVGRAATHLAAEADEARAAGLGCERSYDKAYDALTQVRLGQPPGIRSTGQ